MTRLLNSTEAAEVQNRINAHPDWVYRAASGAIWTDPVYGDVLIVTGPDLRTYYNVGIAPTLSNQIKKESQTGPYESPDLTYSEKTAQQATAVGQTIGAVLGGVVQPVAEGAANVVSGAAKGLAPAAQSISWNVLLPIVVPVVIVLILVNATTAKLAK